MKTAYEFSFKLLINMNNFRYVCVCKNTYILKESTYLDNSHSPLGHTNNVFYLDFLFFNLIFALIL